ncbi:MAG: type II toxin-antitoxin system VapC family toxin [Atopobiaceae bacterium]|nr:type II toxin-antitoxin system VapC family toxin [Atopobiaceae bacterium]
MYLLDTNVVVDFLRGRLPHTYQAFMVSDPRMFGIPSIVEAELRYGIARSKDGTRERMVVDRFIAPLEVVPFDSRCAKFYGQIRQHLASRGMTIGPNDLLIAATALANGAVLVTRNVGEFMRVPGLSVEVWDEVAIQ